MAQHLEDNNGGGLAAELMAAASKRTQRIENGEKKMRTVTSASAIPPRAPEKQDFAAMAAAAAQQRIDRIEASGGNLKITQILEIPESHANMFVNVAQEAANMGRSMRSNEHVVEAESDRVEEKDSWNGPGGLRNQESRRSKFERAIAEAAAMGRMKMNKASETTNYDTTRIIEEEEEEEINIDKQVDEHGRRALRTHFLLDQHVREEYREKKTQWDLSESIDTPEYASIDEVELPTEKLPTFKPKELEYTSQLEASEAFSRAVVASAWERNYRLQRPKAQLRVTRGCKCPYCKNPNAFQTQKYKKMMSDNSSDDDKDHVDKEGQYRDLHAEPQEELPHILKPPEGKIYRMADSQQEQLEETESDEDENEILPKPLGVWKPPPKQSTPAPEPVPQAPHSVYDIQLNGTLQSVPLSEQREAGQYVDFGTTRHKRVHIKREKKPKEAEKVEEKKATQKEDCILM